MATIQRCFRLQPNYALSHYFQFVVTVYTNILYRRNYSHNISLVLEWFPLKLFLKQKCAIFPLLWAQTCSGTAVMMSPHLGFFCLKWRFEPLSGNTIFSFGLLPKLDFSHSVIPRFKMNETVVKLKNMKIKMFALLNGHSHEKYHYGRGLPCLRKILGSSCCILRYILLPI
jgi:hypothetical protein